MDRYNLVFSGSSALYPTHLGAAQALYETVFAKTKPNALVATSGGAIVAALLAGGQRPHECLEMLKRTTPRKFVRKNWGGFWDRVFRREQRRLGLFSLRKLEGILALHTPKTFANAAVRLYITATDLAHNRPVVWSCDSTPMMGVARAACISTSIPGVFALTYDGDRCLADGGLLKSYPIDLVPGPSIGILLRGSDKKERAVVYPKNGLDLAIRCVEVMRRGLEREHIEDAAQWARTIVIDVPWNSSDFFNLGAEEVEELYKVGYRRTLAALDQGVGLAL